MCYQAANGAEHMLSDTERAYNYLKNEYDSTTPSECALYEPICDEICRINISAWKAKGLPIEWLFRIFAASCKVRQSAGEQLASYLQSAAGVIASGDVGFTLQEWERYLSEYKKIGMPPIHHSEQYRKGEHPAYRIADSRFCRVIPILEKTKNYLGSGKPCVIAIDGRAASGKTTLARLLKTLLEADTVHMDDFFLPPELRTKERFNTPGGNIHHERFTEEVLPFISKPEPFSHRIFDCGKMSYSGTREIGAGLFRIVEGAYSHHPKFGEYADITVFSNISESEQTERILRRNGKEMLQMFQSSWIPMEEEYFSHYSVSKRADILI